METAAGENITYNFLGIEVESLTYHDLYHKVDDWLTTKGKRSKHIAVINAHCVMSAYKDERVREIYNKADIVGPDGMPFVSWLRFFRRTSCDQFDATNVLIKLVEHAKQTNYSFYLYGGHPEVVKQMKENLERTYPHIRIVGYRSPAFRSLTKEEDRAICTEINKLKPDILLVGLGTPKQDFWIDEHIDKIRGAVMLPCGAIFDFFGGRVKKAPKFISNLGLEWLYRLVSKDFKRLWYRYTIQNIAFLWHFSLQLAGIKVIPSKRIARPD
jgi:N-acetylglucosaminyldiphosphoundecaprenol N-acetyl-beta-D-mannosaminyltransferase